MGFGGRFFGSLLSSSVLVFCSTLEGIVILCGSIADKFSPGHLVGCRGIPALCVYVALLDVGLDVVLVPPLLSSWRALSQKENCKYKTCFWR